MTCYLAAGFAILILGLVIGTYRIELARVSRRLDEIESRFCRMFDQED